MKVALVNAYQESPFDDLFHLSPMRTGMAALTKVVSRIINTSHGKALVPLALPTLASLTPGDWELEVWDDQIDPVSPDLEADVVGISFTTHSAFRAYKLAEGYRAKGMTVVFGGSHTSLLPEEASRHADAICVGEAEECWPAILNDVRDNRLKKVYRSSDYPDLTNAPIPDFSVLRKENYFPLHSIQASRGCPHTCAFCTVHTIFGLKPRYRSLERIRQELDQVPEKYIAFVDDNLSLNRKYLRGLTQILKGRDKHWFCQSDLNIAKHPELLREMHESGCRVMLVGLESVIPSNLAEFADNKNSMASMQGLIERIHDAGISVLGMFIVGFNHDTSDSMRLLLDFCRSSRITFPSYSILTPYPGTEVFNELEREGRLLHHEWPKYNFYRTVISPLNMNPGELQRMIKDIGMKSFRIVDVIKRAWWHREVFFLLLLIGFGYRRSYKALPW
jgi:radical SAM superfamily enzyme YgiQ (UPF0313 family)